MPEARASIREGTADLDRPLARLFDEAAERSPDAVFLVSRPRPEEGCTYGAFRDQARALARALVDGGVQPGQPVALLCENRPRWCVAWAAAVYSGAVVVTLDGALSEDAIASTLANSGARCALVSAELLPKLDASGARGLLDSIELLDELPEERPEPASPRLRCWTELARGAEVELPPARGGSDLLAILYTSGTTGAAKGVRLTHRNVQAQRAALDSAVQLRDSDVMLMFLPMHHVLSQIGAFLMPAAVGGRVVHVEIQSAQELLAAMREEGISILLAVPLLYHRIHDAILARMRALSPMRRGLAFGLLRFAGAVRRASGWNLGRLLFRAVHAQFGGSLRLLVSGASRLEPRVQRDLTRLGFTLGQAYGLTECSGAASFTPLHDLRLGVVGRALEGVELRIHEPDAEGVGEVCIAGEIVCQGYHQRPRETAELLRDGWLHTGDLGRIESSGDLLLTGRKKDVLVLESGKNVHPEELEAALERGPSIVELCVIERSGALHAVVVPAWDELEALGVTSVRERVRADLMWYAAELPSYLHVLSFQLSREALPRTATRKLQRFRVAEFVERAQVEVEQASPDSPEAAARLASATGLAVASALAERVPRTAELRANTHLELDLGLDSMRRTELFVALESALGVQLDEQLATRIGSVDELVSALAQATSAAPRKDESGTLERGAGYDALVRDASVDELPEWMRAPRGALSAFAFGIVLSLSRIVGRLFFRVRVEGLEQLPREAPFLICPNHQSYADAFLVSPWLPRAIARESFALGFAAYFEGPIGRRLARFSRTIPTDADHNVRASLRVGAAGLTQGRVLVLFPEGSRSMDGSLLELKPGAAVLASRLGLPIVPVAIEGAFEAWPRSRTLPRPGRVRVRFGAPLLPEGESCTHDEGRWLRRLESAYAELGVVGARRLDIDGKSAPAGASNPALPHRDSS